MSIEQIRRLMTKFPKVNFIQTYGQTECAPRVTALLPIDSNRKIGSVGQAIPGVSISIARCDGVEEKYKQYELGEIIVKGTNVMKGYYKNEEASLKIKRNGWIYTGDLGYLDDEGYLYLVGRIKNMIISGGINIYPEEVEGVIKEIKGVKNVCVRGEDDEILGEVPVADIVIGEEIIKKEYIIEHCKKKLTQYKIPTKINFVQEITTTYNGKIKRGMKNE